MRGLISWIVGFLSHREPALGAGVQKKLEEKTSIHPPHYYFPPSSSNFSLTDECDEFRCRFSEQGTTHGASGSCTGAASRPEIRDPRSECPGYPPVVCWQMHRQAFCTFPMLLVHQLSTGIIVEPGNDLELVADWKIQSAHILNQHHQWLAKG